jgi:hypothetical protein
MIKKLLKQTRPYLLWKEYREIRDYWRWLKNGRPVPPPHGIKQGIIKEYAKNYKCPIVFETGTYKGDMIDALKHDFQQIYSVELSGSLYKKARLRFQNDPHITILQGDSGKVLRETLKQIRKPCLFWLDAHYSGADTAKGEKLSPIMDEIIAILNHWVRNHIILIDDAREFTGTDGYPDILEFTNNVTQDRPDLMIFIELDIIRILKK